MATSSCVLLAKTHAAYGRRLEKDWYDLAYVVLHNDTASGRWRRLRGSPRYSQ